jgi:hypothetical protein
MVFLLRALLETTMKEPAQVFIADVTGDGVPDLVILDVDGNWWAINGSTGRTDDIPLYNGSNIPGWPAKGRYFLADFTGDGIADRAYLHPEGRWYVADGSNGGPGVPGIPWGESYPELPGDGRYVVADFNGDGRAERCYIRPDGGWCVVSSDGSKGVPGIPWNDIIPGWPGDGHYLFGDFSGDGIVNRCYVNPAGKFFIVESSGAPRQQGLKWGDTIPGWPGGGRYMCFDFNGDGVAEICYVHPKGRSYCVNTISGAPMDNVPILGDWGDDIPGAANFAFQALLFVAVSMAAGPAASLAFVKTVAVIGAAKGVVDGFIDLVDEKKEREYKVIERREPAWDRAEFPFDRGYEPRFTPPQSPGVSHSPDIETMEINGQGSELEVDDYTITPSDRDASP